MDELSNYLEQKYPKCYITGKQDINILMWGVKEQGIVIPKFLTFIIGREYDPDNVSADYANKILNRESLQDSDVFSLLDFATELKNTSKVPLFIIIYPKFRQFTDKWNESIIKYPLEKVSFFIIKLSKEKTEAQKADGFKLREYLYETLGRSFDDQGSAKAENKRISDYFHFWSRSFLSKYLIKTDIDGFIKDNSSRNILIEIKRSSIPPIPEWRPYLDDKADCILQLKFAQLLGAEYWLLHHESSECNDSTIISFFDINSINDSEAANEFIKVYFYDRRAKNHTNLNEFFSCKEVNFEMPLHGENSLDEKVLGAPIGYCPKCGGKVVYGMYGFYCQKSCKMKVGKLYGVDLSEKEVKALLAGETTTYKGKNGTLYTAYPEIVEDNYNGYTFYRWKSKS